MPGLEPAFHAAHQRLLLGIADVLGIELVENSRKLIWAMLVENLPVFVHLTHIPEDCRRSENTCRTLNKDAL